MKFVIVAMGKSKFSFVEDALEHYGENIGHFGDFELLELKDQSSNAAQEIAKIEEVLERKKWAKDGKTKVLLLDERGKKYSSVGFSKELKRYADSGVQRLVFVIGGAYGFTDDFRKKFPLLSLSEMTFPHDLIRIYLAEQIYRALHIQSGGKYHHDG